MIFLFVPQILQDVYLFPPFPPLLQLLILVALRKPIKLLSFFFILSHIFYCHKLLPLCWAFAVLWSFPLLFFFPPFFNFNFLNLLLFFLHLFLCLFFLFSPLHLICNIYKSALSTSIQLCISILSFFSLSPFVSTYLLALFSLFIPQLAPCFSFVFHFVL